MEEKIFVYIAPAHHAALLQRLARWVTVAVVGPCTWSLSTPEMSGYLYLDEPAGNAALQFEAIDRPTEVRALARLVWFLAIAEDLIDEGIASAIIIGAKDDIAAADVLEQARHAAAWYPETLLDTEKSAYFQLGPFRVSPYAIEHLTTFMTPPSAANGADLDVVTAMNDFVKRQREESARRSVEATLLAQSAMRRLRTTLDGETEGTKPPSGP